jgi:hypothetical protein
VAGVLAWLGAAAYTLWVNPEVAHFTHGDAIKQQWADKMTREHGPKVIVFGGSSCEFSIDGERMLDRHGLPSVNAGRGAGMGVAVLTMAALRDCRSNDTLVVAMEPALLTGSLEIPNLGIQFSMAAGHPEWIREPLSPATPVSWMDTAIALRPGGYHTFTLLGKLIQGRALYRYQPEDLRPSGWIQTPVRMPIPGPQRHGIRIPQDSQQFLRSLRDWCEERRVRLAYSIPWAYTPVHELGAFRRENAGFLLQMADIMPVLRDPRLGAYTVIEHYSDTGWHLTEEGAALRTDELSGQLLGWDTWSRAELERLAVNADLAPGEDGTWLRPVGAEAMRPQRGEPNRGELETR